MTCAASPDPSGCDRRIRRRAVPGLLALASILGVSLLALRLVWSGRLTHFYLVWNLFLAWVPVMFASLAWRFRRGPVALWTFACLWLLFFPNAPYLVTDLVHLRARPPVPLWFDVLLLQLFICLGLMLGYVSLRHMQELVAAKVGRTESWLFAAVALGLAGFGIYLGRFLRWNSWDIVVAPLDLLKDIWTIFRHPHLHRSAIVFSTICGVLLMLGYSMLLALSGTSANSGAWQEAAGDESPAGRNARVDNLS